MPFYEYQCDGCQATFETFVKTIDSDKPACPKCGSRKVSRRPSVFGVGGSTAASSPAGKCGGCAQSGSCPMAQ